MSAETNAAKAALEIIALGLDYHPLKKAFMEACELKKSIVYLHRGMPTVWAPARHDPTVSLIIGPTKDSLGFDRMAIFFFLEDVQTVAEASASGIISAGYGITEETSKTGNKEFTIARSYRRNSDSSAPNIQWMLQQSKKIANLYLRHFQLYGYPEPLPLTTLERTTAIKSRMAQIIT